MLAETLREWEQQLISEGRRTGREEGREAGREEGRRTGREEGRQAGREEERARLRRLAEQRFDAKTADALARLLAADDAPQDATGQ